MERQSYEIRFLGDLGGHGGEWFDGFSIRVEDEVTVLTGSGIDQSTLSGAVSRIRDLNLTLISVRTVPGKGE